MRFSKIFKYIIIQNTQIVWTFLSNNVSNSCANICFIKFSARKCRISGTVKIKMIYFRDENPLEEVMQLIAKLSPHLCNVARNKADKSDEQNAR